MRCEQCTKNQGQELIRWCRTCMRWVCTDCKGEDTWECKACIENPPPKPQPLLGRNVKCQTDVISEPAHNIPAPSADAPTGAVLPTTDSTVIA